MMEPTLLIRRTATYYTVPVMVDSRLNKPDQISLAVTVVVELADYRRVLLPVGFVTDCHSTPAAGQSILPGFNNRTNLAAWVHDRLYMCWEEFLLVYPELADADARAYADAAYLELMERFNRGRFRNRVYLAAVRLFGWWNWRTFRSQATPPTG
ncbi:hypothetical protein GGR92_003665 [Spirosoma lacussanchae]|uniref:DUF1353 domain-containing protein n=1 Tax=Spirosoma lacussanchae TaxID=1884249 RepID=UPI001108FB96|nr:DUF1353 domain-containing protein [Spirosoma lacussanchae]